MPTVAFICSANVCRSPMAHAIFVAEAKRRGLRVNVISAGIWDFEGTPTADEACLACERHQIPMQKFIATHIHNADLEGLTRVFVMEQKHVEALLAKTALPPDRISLLSKYDPQERGADIEDPMGQDAAAFDTCFRRIRDCIVNYLVVVS